jgi:hypothetical protein
LSNLSTTLSAPGFGRGHRLLPTSRLDASSNLALEAAAGADEILLVDADTYGNAVPTPTSENSIGSRPPWPGWHGHTTTLLIVAKRHPVGFPMRDLGGAVVQRFAK